MNNNNRDNNDNNIKTTIIHFRGKELVTKWIARPSIALKM